MDRMKPPRTERYAPYVLTLDELRVILSACVRTFFNTGARWAEIAGLHYSPTDPADRDVDLAPRLLYSMGVPGARSGRPPTGGLRLCSFPADALGVDVTVAAAGVKSAVSEGCSAAIASD